MTHVPETGDRKMEPIYGTGFWPCVMGIVLFASLCALVINCINSFRF